MRLRFTSLVLAVVLISTVMFGQTAVKFTLAPIGVSPRDVERSTTDIYTLAATGLKNVGVGSLMYFQSSLVGKKFGTAVTYTVTRRPQGSTAAVGTTRHLKNDSTQVVTFTPDRVGAYELTVTDGSFTTLVTFNAAKFLGYKNTVVNGVDTKLNCNTCHSTIVKSYEKTHHATALKSGVDNIYPNNHFASYCVSCHTTGHDAATAAKNDGFDDFPFTFPTVLAPGTHDKLKTQFPDAMQRADVQCESCHGPASSHLGAVTDSRMQATYSADVCADCHDSGIYAIFPEQFDASLHSGATAYPTGPGRESCVRCHTGAGFAQYTKGIPSTDPYFDVSYSPITCAGCHNPHDATNPNQLRKITAETYVPNPADLKVGIYAKVEGAGKGAFCINCHQSRAEANASRLAATISTRFGPHYAPQGDVLVSKNMLELGGQKLHKSNHLGPTEDSCIKCHMYKANSVVGTTVNQWGGHTFSMGKYKKDANGNYVYGKDHKRVKAEDNMEACAQCHGSTFGPTFADAKFFMSGKGDHDNDGIVEGLQDEVWGMVNKVMTKLGQIPGSTFSPEYGQYDAAGKFIPFPVPLKAWTLDQLGAYWNALTANNDGSGGIHNPKYIITALKGAMSVLGIPVGINQDNEAMPTTYALQQNYPNPFNPSTTIKFSVPKAGNVRLVVYDVLGKEVATLVNNFLNAGQYNFQFNASNLASGIYLYRLEAGSFTQTNKMLLMK